jgi:hypothetical protein
MRARVASSSTTDSSPSSESAIARRRYTAEEVRALVATAPPFVVGRLDEDELTRICAEYERITGDRARTTKKRGFLAASYRVHGRDFLPFVRERFAATGTATNLLLDIRRSAPRTPQAATDNAVVVPRLPPFADVKSQSPREDEVEPVDVAPDLLANESDRPTSKAPALQDRDVRDRPVEPRHLSECYPGLLYGPRDRPPFDPTSTLRWDDSASNPDRDALRAQHLAALRRLQDPFQEPMAATGPDAHEFKP